MPLNLLILRRGLCVGLVLALLSASAEAPAETILQRGNKDEPETLDPHKSDGYQEYWVQSDLFEGLTRTMVWRYFIAASSGKGG